MKRSSICRRFGIALLATLSVLPPRQPALRRNPHSDHLSARPHRSDRAASSRRAGPRRVRRDVSAVRFFVDDVRRRRHRRPDLRRPVDRQESVRAGTIRAEAVRADGVVGIDSGDAARLDITDEAEVASVLIDISVLDEKGRYVKGLTREHFPVYEDDKAQTIELIDAATVPTTHTLLVDTSNSMSYRFDFVRRVARRMGSSMKPSDQMVVLRSPRRWAR